MVHDDRETPGQRTGTERDLDRLARCGSLVPLVFYPERGGDPQARTGVVDQPRALPAGARLLERGHRGGAPEALRARRTADRGDSTPTRSPIYAAGLARDPVAIGCYVEYDRHDAFSPTHREQTRVARLPMGALQAQGHPWLLVSTAVSTDYEAYCSAVRMEHMRAAMGGAAGAMVASAERLGTSPDRVPYTAVRSQLLSNGYRLDPVD